MKWPKQLTLIRHGESMYNQLKTQREQDPLYHLFVKSFDRDWQSNETKDLAIELAKVLSRNNGEDLTALTEKGRRSAIETGQHLSQQVNFPDVIYVSPYLRTMETLEGMLEGWPELKSVEVIVDERIREQDFGLRLLYGDWRVMQVFHPEQRLLYRLQGDYWYRQPQGENVPDVRARSWNWGHSLSRDWSGKNVLAITHHLTILAFHANVLRMNPKEFLDLYKQKAPPNCSLTQYRNGENTAEENWLESVFYCKRI
jgi:broad specificity phosphatase PhoE